MYPGVEDTQFDGWLRFCAVHDVLIGHERIASADSSSSELPSSNIELDGLMPARKHE